MADSEIPGNLADLIQDESKPCSNNGDESSIEALSWSDFEDDLNDEETKLLLQSINSQYSEVGGDESLRDFENEHQHPFLPQDEDSILLSGLSESVKTVMDERPLEEEIVHGIPRKRSRINGDMITSTLSVASLASEITSVDSVSNAPVLDDGPIWAKGSKLYKFEENRRFNQKLTFCVLFSLVLAIGLGVGNLAAYNECEADKSSYNSEGLNNRIPDDKPVATSNPQSTTLDDIVYPTDIPSAQTLKKKEAGEIKLESLPENEKPNPNRPMIDPKYALHAEELSRVLKMLDELSRKIDRFENTTRQLSGIVMLRDDVVLKDAPTKKGKFLKLLDDIMKNKGKKEKKVEESGQETWREKKEQVLDDIAEAVLDAMDVKESAIEEIETKPDEPPIPSKITKKQKREVNNNVVKANENTGSEKNKKVEDKKISGKLDNRKMPKGEYDANSTLKPNDKLSSHSRDYEDKHKKPKAKKDTISNPTPQGNLDKIETKKIKESKVSKSKDWKKKINEAKIRIESKYEDWKNKKKDAKIKTEESKPKDWQADRAKSREEKRIQKDKKNFRNKKGKNWQIERDMMREALRN